MEISWREVSINCSALICTPKSTPGFESENERRAGAFVMTEEYQHRVLGTYLCTRYAPTCTRATSDTGNSYRPWHSCDSSYDHDTAYTTWHWRRIQTPPTSPSLPDWTAGRKPGYKAHGAPGPFSPLGLNQTNRPHSSHPSHNHVRLGLVPLASHPTTISPHHNLNHA
jgi:hypothetical protein